MKRNLRDLLRKTSRVREGSADEETAGETAVQSLPPPAVDASTASQITQAPRTIADSLNVDNTNATPYTTADVPESWSYKPLLNYYSIRLLHVAPGRWDDPITCTLDQIDLALEPRPYETISYAWGNTNNRKDITCDGCVISITQSLFEALRQLRHDGTGVSPWHPRTLWADAICIDQTNTWERGLQVQLMGLIYRLATKQLIWLGPTESEDKVRVAFDYICRYAVREVRHQPTMVYYVTRGNTIRYPVEGRYPLADNLTEETKDALREMFSCPVFRRGWVRRFYYQQHAKHILIYTFTATGGSRSCFVVSR
jgi:hypothetical protein